MNISKTIGLTLTLVATAYMLHQVLKETRHQIDASKRRSSCGTGRRRQQQQPSSITKMSAKELDMFLVDSGRPDMHAILHGEGRPTTYW